MNKIQTEKLQVMISPETFHKLNKLIAAEALEKGERIQTLSGWCRNLIEDTINFELNKKKIDNFDYKRDIKNIVNK